jgi:transcriptional regulator with XRE-family HTH domain
MNAVDNIERWMRAKGIGQQELADRLTRFDSSPEDDSESESVWHRRTVNRLLNGQRRIDLDEVYSIALALDVTVGMILFPDAPEDSNSGVFRIGGMPPVGNWEMTAMLAKPAEVVSQPSIGIGGWDTDEPLTWVRKPSATDQALQVLKSAYEAAHPGIDISEAPAGDVLKWAEEQGAEVDP